MCPSTGRGVDRHLHHLSRSGTPKWSRDPDVPGRRRAAGQGCCAYAPSRSSSVPPAHVSRNDPLEDASGLITTVLSAGSQRPFTARVIPSAVDDAVNRSVTVIPDGTVTSVVDPLQSTVRGPGRSETASPDAKKGCGVAATDA